MPVVLPLLVSHAWAVLMPAQLVLPGALSVRCPVCRAQPGRPCTNRRGYLIDTHRPRLDDWLDSERDDPDPR